nr:NADH dehydrogenase subunit 2 [Ovalona pulchella]
MLLTPSLLLFWSSIVFSIFFMLSSPSFFLAWVALEINTLAFVPFLLSTQVSASGENALKYFLSQTFGSILFLLSLLSPLILSSYSFEAILFGSALMLKLGAAPFHAWLPAMVSSLSWESFFMLLTLQKLNPLILLSYFLTFSFTYLFIGAFSLIVGALMGLIQTQTRKLLTYSSINQVGWMIISLWVSKWLMLFYFFFYVILSLPVIFMLKHFNINMLSQLTAKKTSNVLQMFFYMNLLSFGGLPPFLGFLPKWMVLSQLIISSQLTLSFIMVILSLITLFYYLRLTYNSFLMNSNQWNFMTAKLPSFILSFTFVNLFALSLAFLI